MKSLMWPLLDNKLLKQPGVGFKLLLPDDLGRLVDREESSFFQRARLDKQNMIRSLEWSPQSLYDVANARIKACSKNPEQVSFKSLFEDQISEIRINDALRSLRVPRNLFQFMYRLLVAHCNAHTEEEPEWKFKSDTFESTFALFRRDQEVFVR